ncbi:helix-turn-helix domain-containing protein [Thalassobaculum salexigens]|uniref:helix-turn-helix domain-containing protein n=1 Tax=Thalassobaculum salexigens TaxID=455360 RepID=UPI00048F659B|nr:helix-turn-helix transcriptional regulator [Thalassobaculum salexigens]
MANDRPGRRRVGRPPTATNPNPIDIHVGTRVRLRRTLLGMSQERLGEALGLTFQQVQKYERGANRVGASRLFELAKALGVPVSYFFDDMPGEDGVEPSVPAAGPMEEDPMRRRETIELVRAYYRITDDTARRRLYELMRSIAGSMDGEKP